MPFGTLIPGESSGSTNPVFTSYDRSLITGLDYAVNRTYDHDERFTQPDPAPMAAVNLMNPQSMNLYAYVGNDPVNLIDPTGLFDFGGIFGGGSSQCLDPNGEYSDCLKQTGGNHATVRKRLQNGYFWDWLNSYTTGLLANVQSGIGNLASDFIDKMQAVYEASSPSDSGTGGVDVSGVSASAGGFSERGFSSGFRQGLAPTAFGIGFVVDAQYFFGGELNVQLVGDVNRRLGLLLTPAARVGADINLSAGVAGFFSWAPSINNLSGGNIGSAVDLGLGPIGSIGISTSLNPPLMTR